MKAPEKIYRTTTHLDGDRGKTLWKTKPVAGAENIEYTRTDAFIDKACNAYCRLCDTKECNDTGECNWIEKFKKLLMK